MISSGFTTVMEIADMALTQLTLFRMLSGMVNCPLLRIILIVFIFSDYQVVRIGSSCFGYTSKLSDTMVK